MERRTRYLPRCQARGCESDAATERQLAELGWQLIEAEGALDFQRRRAARAEYELAVVESALLRLLQAVGSEVADLRDLRVGLGLSA
jgi:hypothetical protein